MQSAKWLYDITSRAEIWVIVVHEHDLGADISYLIDGRSLHSWPCPDRHKYRSLDLTMRSHDRTSTSSSVSRIESKGKRCMHKIFGDYRKKVEKSEFFAKNRILWENNNMGHFSHWHFRILYNAEREQGGKIWSSDKEQWGKKKELSYWERVQNVATQFANVDMKEFRSAIDELSSAEESNIKAVRDTCKILRSTGAIPDLKDIPSLVARWTEWSGLSGMRAVISALRLARTGHLSIITYANGVYTSYKKNEYEAYISKNPEVLNGWVVAGLVHLYRL